MDITTILKELLDKQDVILKKYAYVEEVTERSSDYKVLKKAMENISKAINQVNNQDILKNSYIFVNEKFEDYSLSELIDRELVYKAPEVECVVEK